MGALWLSPGGGLLPAAGAHSAHHSLPSLPGVPGLPADAPLHAWRPWSWPSQRPGGNGLAIDPYPQVVMNQSDAPAYGLWGLAVVNAAVFIFFAFSFFKPKTPRDWRSFGAFSAFLVALFAEMYGFPLTIYILSGWLQSRYPSVNWLSHDAGHLLETLFGWRVNPHFGPFHIASFVLIGGGFMLIARGWDHALCRPAKA